MNEELFNREFNFPFEVTKEDLTTYLSCIRFAMNKNNFNIFIEFISWIDHRVEIQSQINEIIDDFKIQNFDGAINDFDFIIINKNINLMQKNENNLNNAWQLLIYYSIMYVYLFNSHIILLEKFKNLPSEEFDKMHSFALTQSDNPLGFFYKWIKI